MNSNRARFERTCAIGRWVRPTREGGGYERELVQVLKEFMDSCQVQSAHGSGGVGLVVVVVAVASEEIVVYKMQNPSQKMLKTHLNWQMAQHY